MKTPEVRRRAILSVVTTKEDQDPGQPKAGENEADPVIPKDHEKWLARWNRAHPATTPRKPRRSLRELNRP